MKEENAIEVKNITKTFRVYLDKGKTLKEMALFSRRRKYEKRQVLNGISFEVKKGEAIGLVGHNGCGKSTTLKLLTRIMYPDSGTIEMRGRVSSLIELGAGFHPDMSGRQNIYTNASIFGLSKKEIDQRIDKIIEFSELEDFIDNPVRTYSSGMYMRLAFSVAINVDADILLIDEILAVGDANFQAKCFERLREIKLSGVTIVIVTHDTGVVERFCDRAIWINDGKVQYSGNSADVIDHYLIYMNEEKFSQQEKEEKRRREYLSKLTKEEQAVEAAKDITNTHFGTFEALLTKIELLDHARQKTTILRGGEEYFIDYEYEIENTEKEYVFGMGIYTLEGHWIFGTNTLIGKVKVPKRQKGRVSFHGVGLALLSGDYILQVSITDIDGTPVDFYREYCKFSVVNEHREAGMVHMQHKWEL